MDRQSLIAAINDDLIKHGGSAWKHLKERPVGYMRHGMSEYITCGDKRIDVTGSTPGFLVSTALWMAE